MGIQCKPEKARENPVPKTMVNAGLYYNSKESFYQELSPPRVLSPVSAGSLVTMRANILLAGDAHLFILRPTSRVSLLGRANVVREIIVGVAASLIVQVNVDGSRARATLARQLRVARLELLGLERLVEMLLEQTHILAVALDSRVRKIAQKYFVDIQPS